MENSVHAYAATTDGCPRLVRGTSDNTRQWQQVKPDPETHALAEFDYEGGDVGSARATRYSSASEYVRWIVIAPKCSAVHSSSVAVVFRW